MPLKETEIEKFKNRLEEMRRQITHSLRGSTAEVKTPDEATGYSFKADRPCFRKN